MSRTTCCCELTSSKTPKWIIDLQFPHPFQMDFQLVSLHLFTANRHLCHTSGSHLSALGRYDRGITVTFGTTWQSLIRQNLANTQSLSPCFSSGVCVGAAALKSLVFLLGFRAKEFLHHQLRSASYPDTVRRQPWFRAAEEKRYSPLKKVSQNHHTIYSSVPSWCWTLLSGRCEYAWLLFIIWR